MERRTMWVATEVESILRREHSVKWFRVKAVDGIRLLRLKQWEEKYRVSVQWILSKLIPFWKEKYSVAMKSKVPLKIAYSETIIE